MAVARQAAPHRDDTRRAFDAVAPEYDAANRCNPILEQMRARSLAMLAAHAAPGSHVLDLGCGPGTDFASLVDAGYQVTAVDGSAAMADQAGARARAVSGTGAVQVYPLDITDIDRLPCGAYDAVYSSFGPLNCVPDLDHVARLVADRLRPGGVLVASVIGRVCPWELAYYAWRREWPRMRIRFAAGFVPVPLGTGRIWTRYYTPGEFEAPFRAAGFERTALRALGLLVPPPYMARAAARHRAITAALQRAEDRVARWPGLRSAGDHFLIVLRRW